MIHQDLHGLHELPMGEGQDPGGRNLGELGLRKSSQYHHHPAHELGEAFSSRTTDVVGIHDIPVGFRLGTPVFPGAAPPLLRLEVGEPLHRDLLHRQLDGNMSDGL